MKSAKNVQNIYKDFFHTTVEAIFFTDTDGRFLFWNKGCEHLFGYTEEEAKDLSFFSLIEAGNLDVFTSLFESIKKGRTLCFEILCSTKDNRVLETEITASAIDKEENAIYFTVRDISRVKQVQDRLRNLAVFPENNPDFVLEWDKHNGIRYYNQTVKDFLKRNGSGDIHVDKILPANYLEHVHNLVGSNRTLRDVETTFENRVISYTFTPFRKNDTKVLIIGKDITGERLLRAEVDSAYQRTTNILGFIENVLKELRFVDLEQDIDLLPVASQYLRDSYDTTSFHPTHILIALENDERQMVGTLMFREDGQIKKVQKHLVFQRSDLRGVLSTSETAFGNCMDDSCFMERFPEGIKKYIPEIKNFASYRITGERSGVFVGFNYAKNVTSYDTETIKGLAVAVGTVFSFQAQFREKEEAQFTAMIKLAELAEKRDNETGEHLKRIRSYARILAEELQMLPKYQGIIDRSFIKKLFDSAALHDIGKVGIPDAVLQKPGKLTSEEFEQMRQHPVIGGDILQGPKFLSMARDIALYHHEKFDGSGYPYGLKGEDIPLAARIVAAADVYDAMTSPRVYKEPLSHERTKKLIEICSGGHFDADVVNAFLAREQDFIRIKSTYR